MRYAMMILAVSAAMLMALSGCKKQEQAVEMSPPPEPGYDENRPQLNEIRPVDEGDANAAGGETTPTLSVASSSRPYTIQAGDTYWRIAATQLGNGQRWREIQALNPGVNMNALRIGQTIQIPVK